MNHEMAGRVKQKTQKERSPIERAANAPTLTTWVVKILILGILNAMALFAIFILLEAGDFVFLSAVAVVTLLLNWVYLRRGSLPAKYLAPGLVFMAIFQIFVVIYSGYVAFTNYGTSHNSTKEDALNAMMLNGQTRVAEAEVYGLSVVVDDQETLHFLATLPSDEGEPEVFLGNAEEPLRQISDYDLNSRGVANQTPGFQTLSFAELVERQDEVLATKVYLTDEIDSYFLMTSDGSQAVVFQPRLEYDAENDTVTRISDGKVFFDVGEGMFTAQDGEIIRPGWREFVGFDNFVEAVSNEGIREPLIYVLTWNFAFAILSVFSTFALGLALALMLNDSRIRGQKFYRAAMILPYAFPAFLSAFVFQALYNQDYGWINQVLLGGADIPWLNDIWWSKAAILLLNLWLGFPYMFLITTGALQSIPEELTESARIDGASAWQVLMQVKLPMLMVTVAPLLIAAFAFNFNNFAVIYLLTKGGPTDFDADIPVGHTDILLSMVYKIAFSTGEGRDFGLASAFSILIFLIIATISYFSFRRTRTLEDVN